MVVENQKNGDNRIPRYLREKRNELIWALSLQHYSNVHIAQVFNLNRATTLRIIRQKPRDWKPKWVKSES